jgi:hypothetical protein
MLWFGLHLSSFAPNYQLYGDYTRLTGGDSYITSYFLWRFLPCHGVSIWGSKQPALESWQNRDQVENYSVITSRKLDRTSFYYTLVSGARACNKSGDFTQCHAKIILTMTTEKKPLESERLIKCCLPYTHLPVGEEAALIWQTEEVIFKFAKIWSINKFAQVIQKNVQSYRKNGKN